MHLRRQDKADAAAVEEGYAMAVLLVAMSITAVLMTVAMPAWKQMVQRDREEELLFRGRQYARAVGLFQRKYANANPPDIDVLLREKFLRTRYKDPITNDDFQTLLAGQAGGTGPTPQGGRGRGTAAVTPTPSLQQPGQTPAGRGVGTPGAGAAGGVVGVVSKSKDKSIKIYNGRTHYNEWTFVYTAPAQAPGAGGVPGTAVPGQRGQGPGQRGQPGQQNNPFGGQGPFGGPGRNPNAPGPGRNPNGPPNPGGRGFGNPGGFNPFQPVPPAPNTPPTRGR